MTNCTVFITSALSLNALSHYQEGVSLVIAVPHDVWDQWRFKLHSKMQFENITDVADRPVFDVPLPDGRVVTVQVTRMVLTVRPNVQVCIIAKTPAAASAKA